MLKVIAGRKAELKTKDCGGSDCAKGCDGGGRGSGCTVAMLEATAEVEVIVSSQGHVHRAWLEALAKSAKQLYDQQTHHLELFAEGGMLL